MPNEKIKAYAKRKGIPLWQIAGGYHISENWLSKKLRREWSEAEQADFIRIVDELAYARYMGDGATE